MGEDTDQLSTEIATTRGNLANHLDELQDKVSPAAIVDRKKAAARDRVGSVRSKVMGSAGGAKESVTGAVSGAGGSVSGTASDAADTAKDQFQGSPLAAGVAAFGLGMVIAALVPATRAESRAAVQVKDAVQEHAQPLVEDVRSAAAEVGGQVKENAADAVEQVKQTGQEATGRVKDEGTSAAQNVRSDAQG
ncbi:DUF3618 domain-containing protein [Nocardioides dongxiaopingii]|uniref:DUF3618 domain-containing protein n=1 Tax=Nocardioides TaxID=1839 RepID=UPI0010C769AA|nr:MULTISPECIES: DUF3618 domain-containing protein [Nocardioides]QCW51602.1 DUF3618 domain-containing protein [Nocardioides sp. S-1144]